MAFILANMPIVFVFQFLVLSFIIFFTNTSSRNSICTFEWVRKNYETSTHHQPKYIHHHPPPPITIHHHQTPAKNIHHHPTPPTDSLNISTTTNRNPKYIQVRRYSIRKILKYFKIFYI